MNNLIYYFDSMMIANEGVKEGFQKIKSWLITQFNKLLDLLQKAVNHFKAKNLKKNNSPGPIASSLQQLIARCKAGLSKSKALNAQNPELANKLKDEVSNITEEYKILKDKLELGAAIGAKGTPGNYKKIGMMDRTATVKEAERYGKRIEKLNNAAESLTSLMI